MVKDRYIRNIAALMGGVDQAPNSPAGLRAQQLSKEALLLTLYACFSSPKRTCRASAFNYITQDTSQDVDPSIWDACMVCCSFFSLLSHHRHGDTTRAHSVHERPYRLFAL